MVRADRRRKLARGIIGAYNQVYAKSPDEYWHGINVVALLARAMRDGLPLPKFLPPTGVESPYFRELATRILTLLRQKENAGEGDAWVRATAMEACVALGDTAEAVRWARDYVHSDNTDAFELASTLRQLKEIWQLNNQIEPGSLLLPLLEAELLKEQGGVIKIDATNPPSQQAAQLAQAGQLEKVFGRDSYAGSGTCAVWIVVAASQDWKPRPCKALVRACSYGKTPTGPRAGPQPRTGWPRCPPTALTGPADTTHVGLLDDKAGVRRIIRAITAVVSAVRTGAPLTSG